MKLNVPFHHQKTSYTCGPAALQMVFEYFKYWRPQEELAREAGTEPQNGTATQAMIKVATEHGFYCYVNNRSTFHEVRHFLEKGLPVIVNFIEPSNNEGHFAVITGLTRWFVILNDPWNGKNARLSRREFLRRWHDEHNRHHEWIMVLAKDDFHLGRQYFPNIQKSAI